MIDNPASWFILLFLAVFAIYIFLQKIDAELSQNRRENDDFFIKMKWENKYNQRRF